MKKLQDEQRQVKTSNSGNFMKNLKQNMNQRGSLEFAFGNLFKCVCCVHTGITHEEKQLNEIFESLQQIDKRINLLDRLTSVESNNIAQLSCNDDKYAKRYFPMEEMTMEEELHQKLGLQHATSDSKSDRDNEDVDEDSDILTQMSATSSREHSSFLISPYWLQDERMRKGEVDFLSNFEEEFWKDLIEKYLRPIETDEETQNRIAQELMNCRDAYLLKFFMINALFVLIVFLMQLNKETLHLQWPLGMKYNVTYDTERNEVHVTKEYLRLEPIGCLFIIAFVSILGIQFIAMLVHRINTFTHVLANKKLKLPCCTKIISSDDGTFEKDADEIAQGLQHIAEDEIIYELKRSMMTAPSRRKTIHELTENAQAPSRTLGNLERLFRRKLHNPNVSGLSEHVSSRVSKNVFSAFERRRSILAKKRKTQVPELYNIYDDANNPRSSNNQTFHPRPRQSHMANQFQYDNPGFIQNENF